MGHRAPPSCQKSVVALISMPLFSIMKTPVRPFVSALQRAYTAQAAVASQVTSDSAPRVSRLANGAIVATVENNSPVARLAVLYNAGSRYEVRDNEGVTHCIRSAANLSNGKSSTFNLTRNFQQIGSNVKCSTTREHVIYSVDCTRNHLDVGLEFLTHMSCYPSFQPWEISDNRAEVKIDLALAMDDPCTRAIEGLHRAAYRDGLGYSLHMPEYRLGSHSVDQLSQFVKTHYVPGNMAIVGVGVDHDALLHRLDGPNGLEIGKIEGGGPVAAAKAVYHGGEVRIANDSPLVHAAVATQGVSLGSSDLIAAAVLQNLMGTGPRIKYSANANAKVTQAAAQATSDPFAVSTINLNYRDTGLFGFHVAAGKSDIGSVLKSLISTFSAATKAPFSDADVASAKAQLKASMLYELENSGSLVEELGSQVLLSGSSLPIEKVLEHVDAITAADVLAVAKKVVNGKPSMCIVGDLAETPYLDELA